MSLYSPSAPVVHRNTAPSNQKPPGYRVSRSTAYMGLRLANTCGVRTRCDRPSISSMPNQTNMMGPNARPTTLVPKRWKKNNRLMMATTMSTVAVLPGAMMPANTSTPPKPSMAAATEIGGVRIPSANKVAAPMMAGIQTHFPKRRTSVYREKTPPSPRLSARRVMRMYLKVVCRVSVQKMQLKAPSTTRSLMGVVSPMIALNTYNGEVPMSPKMIPSVTSMPAQDKGCVCAFCMGREWRPEGLVRQRAANVGRRLEVGVDSGGQQ